MTIASVENWLEKLGYADERELLHRRGETIPSSHPYALEIHALLREDGSIGARAVFDVEGVPTIIFLDGDLQAGASRHTLDDTRKRIWNQNLATIVIHVRGDQAVALPARKLKTLGHPLRFDQVRKDGPFSVSDVVSARLTGRVPEWFDKDARVDHKLLDNISTTVRKLTLVGFRDVPEEARRRQLAEFLMGEVLFVSYLEHREIVGPTYRKRRRVGRMLDLVDKSDRQGVHKLIDHLRSDFNGDFLAEDSHDPWVALTEPGYELLNQFLRRTDMRTGQGDFWNYDFSYIPVELLSGLYELFLSPKDRARQGAFYTPRNLAALAIDQAFEHSPNPLSETIFDGACGSGILLTTAYRRLISLSEQQIGRQLAFAERCELLQQAIFGGDTNPMACRVTAFSLYLSIFEGLEPADIMEAQERDAAKLPSLKGTNLAEGPVVGDFFSDAHEFAPRRFSLVVSNPPWREPEGTERTSADDWAVRTREPFVRRQIAGAYALRALDFLQENGRMCLLLPIGQLLGDTSATFVARLLQRYQPLRIINFGDLQELLFPTARHGCHVFTGRRREYDVVSALPFRETFDYCVPKADLTLALGHLTMQSADRHRLQTVSVAEDPQQLVARMWGDANDLAIWTRLTARGTFAEFINAAQTPWKRTIRKGVRLRNKGQPDMSAAPLRSLPHLRPESLTNGSPILHTDLLEGWPRSQNTVVGLNEALMQVFDGPRVLFPDGVSQLEMTVRAHYYNTVATFTHSIGVIASNDKDDDPLLKFAAVYLRSTLARYFLMLRAWKILGARGGFHLTDIKTFPFFPPDHAPNPASAQRILSTVSRIMDDFANLSRVRQTSRYHEKRQDIDRLVYDYFGLGQEEQTLVHETVNVLLPSIRPSSLGALHTPAQQVVQFEDYRAYAKALGESLTRWRTRMRGAGHFRVTVNGTDPHRDGPSGIVRVDYSRTKTRGPEIQALIDDNVVLQTLELLRRAGLRRIRSGLSLGFVPDTHLWLNGSVYLVRPATKRSWTVRQALRDAEDIVRLAQPDPQT